MIIRIDKERGLVDFGAPVNMSKPQFNQFVKFFEKTLGFEIIQQKTADISRDWGEREVSPKKWTAEDYLILITPMPPEEKEKKLNRTSMSIWMKIADFGPKFNKWALEKGIKLPVTSKTIELFIQESGYK